jgi:hypothetical protein
MTDTPTPPRTPTAKSPARGFSDLHCLWRFCGRRRCLRARACRSDPSHCLYFMRLVPVEAREFIQHWDDALREGLTFEEMMEEHAEQWQMLTQWQALVASTLPENRPKKARLSQARPSKAEP